MTKNFMTWDATFYFADDHENKAAYASSATRDIIDRIWDEMWDYNEHASVNDRIEMVELSEKVFGVDSMTVRIFDDGQFDIFTNSGGGHFRGWVDVDFCGGYLAYQRFPLLETVDKPTIYITVGNNANDLTEITGDFNFDSDFPDFNLREASELILRTVCYTGKRFVSASIKVDDSLYEIFTV